MKSFAQLSRNHATDIFRKKREGINMMLRKQYRRIRRMNYLAKDYTNEQTPNSWFNSKKLKALALHYQTMRNMHPGTIKIPTQLKKQITQKFTQDSHWLYFNYRNAMQQHVQYKQFLNNCDIQQEIVSLPAKIRQQIQVLKDQKVPEMINPIFHYSQQYQICLPKQQKYRKNLTLKIKNPPKDKSLEQDQGQD